MKKLLALLFALALLPSDALGQAVQQSGSVTPGHVVKWLTTGVIGDGGTAANGSLTSLGVTNAGGPGICVNSGPITGAYNALCMSASTAAAGRITLQNYGGAAAQNLQFCTNGNCLTVPASGGSGTIPTIITPTITNETICAVDTAGNLGGCPAGSAHGMPFYTTSQILASTAAMTNGQIVVGQTGGDPTPRSLSGDVSTISSTGAVTITKVNGVPFPATYTANLPLIGNGTGLIAQGTRSGNTTSFATTTGTLTNGNCVSIDASGNLVAAGGACTTSGGGGTVSSGTANQLAYYASSGSTVVGLTSANSGLLITSGAGVPSISTAIPNGVIATTQTATDSSTKVATTAFVQTKTSVGSAGAIQMAAASGAFADSTFISASPSNGTLPTGKILVVPNIGCTGCSGSSFALLSPQSLAGFAPGGHETYVGDFLTVGGVASGAGSVAVGSEQSVVSANHCTLLANAGICSADGGIVIGHSASVPSSAATSIAMGVSALANAAGEIIIGGSSTSTDTGGYGVAIGFQSALSSSFGVAIGRQATVPNLYGVAIGYQSTVTANAHAVVGGPFHTDFYGCSDTAPCYGNFGALKLNPPITKVADYAVVAYDNAVIFNCSGSCTLTLPAAVNNPGRILRVKTIANQVVVSASGNIVPLAGGAAGTAILAGTAGKWADLQSDDTNWVIMASN